MLYVRLPIRGNRGDAYGVCSVSAGRASRQPGWAVSTATVFYLFFWVSLLLCIINRTLNNSPPFLSNKYIYIFFFYDSHLQTGDSVAAAIFFWGGVKRKAGLLFPFLSRRFCSFYPHRRDILPAFSAKFHESWHHFSPVSKQLADSCSLLVACSTPPPIMTRGSCFFPFFFHSAQQPVLGLCFTFSLQTAESVNLGFHSVFLCGHTHTEFLSFFFFQRQPASSSAWRYKRLATACCRADFKSPVQAATVGDVRVLPMMVGRHGGLRPTRVLSC